MINCFENKIKTAIIEVEKLNILKLETKPTRDCKLPPIIGPRTFPRFLMAPKVPIPVPINLLSILLATNAVNDGEMNA